MLLTGIGAGGSWAQTASFRSVDTNGDRVLDFDELVAAFGERGARSLLSSMDRNRDGQITIPELRAEQGESSRTDSDSDRSNGTQSSSGRNESRDDDEDDRDDDRDDGDDGGDNGGDDGDDGGDDGDDGDDD